MLVDGFVFGLDPTIRTLGAGLTAMVGTAAIGVPVVAWLRAQKLRDGECRKESAVLADLHAKAGKANTPTMGGLAILSGLALTMLVWAPIQASATWIAAALVLAFATIGAIDDWAKLHRHRRGVKRDGLRGRTKLVIEVALATLAMVGLAAVTQWPPVVYLPFLEAPFDIGILYVPFAVFIIVGSANAANLTDGLDGLAAGVVGTAAAGLAVGAVALSVLGGVAMSSAAFLSATAHPGMATDAAWFAAALAGCCVGFLWHNRYPARVFMGDTGSLALGAGLGMAAVLLRAEWALVAFCSSKR